MIYSDLLSQLSAKRSSHDMFPFFLGGGGWTRLDWNNPEHPQIPGQRPHCRKSYTSGGQNNTFSAFRCQKIDREGCKKRRPKLLGPKIRNNKGAREPEVSDKSQNLRDKNNWWKDIQVGEEKREAMGKLCKKFNSCGTRNKERWKEGDRSTRRVGLNVTGEGREVHRMSWGAPKSFLHQGPSFLRELRIL